MDYQIIEAPQGSEAWHQARKNCFTASEAPAALGVSKYQTRDELLAQKKTGLTKEVDASTQRLFDRGHETEALARVIAEEIIGSDLYPITAMAIDSDLPLLASMDGLTLEGDIGFEHKLLSKSLIEQIAAKKLDAHYTVQMDQQMLITGCSKILFMASDGTKENCYWLWYEAKQANFTNLISGWRVFQADLQNYVPPVHVEKVVAETVEALPVPSVVVRGEITQSNIAEITPKFDAYLESIKTELSTDQDFADAEANAKNCREMGKRIEALQENIIAQMVSVNEVNGTLENYKKAFNQVGLRLEKAVKEQKESLKTQAIMKAKQDYSDYLNTLQDDCAVVLSRELQAPDFATAIKGIKTIASMHSRINDALAQGKAYAKQFADDVRTKVEFIKASIQGYEHLINVPALALKDLDFIKLHIQSVKDAEDNRKAEHEAAIKAKAEAEARAKVEAEQRAKQLTEAQPINEATPVKAEAVTLPSQAEAVSIAPQVEHAFAATTTQPSREQIVSLVADHYGVTHRQAQGWLNDLFYAMAA